MSSFTKLHSQDRLMHSAQLDNLLGGNNFTVTKPFSYHIGSKESNEVVTIPEGFIVNAETSVPNMMGNVFEYSDKTALASVVHAYLNEYGKVTSGKARISVDYRYADKVFLEALKVAGVTGLRLIYLRIKLLLYRLLNTNEPITNIESKKEIEYALRHTLNTEGQLRLTQEQTERLLNKYPTLKGQTYG